MTALQELVRLSLLVGWLGILAGVLTGALIGLFFHREQWMGGYGSFRRRMTRLGHIACFGIGFLNIFFALSLAVLGEVAAGVAAIGCMGLLLAMITMPTLCFLTAWKAYYRHFFFIPVTSAAAGVGAMIYITL